MTSPPAPTRVSRTRDQARAGYDRIAGIYDWLAGASERPFRRRALDLLAIQPGEAVLEIGCGTGEALVELASISTAATGVDLSPRMLDQARRRLDAAGRVASTMSADGGHALAMALYAWAHRRFPVAVDCRPLHLGAVLGAGGFSADRVEHDTMWGLGVAWAVARPVVGSADVSLPGSR